MESLAQGLVPPNGSSSVLFRTVKKLVKCGFLLQAASAGTMCVWSQVMGFQDSNGRREGGGQVPVGPLLPAGRLHVLTLYPVH